MTLLLRCSKHFLVLVGVTEDYFNNKLGPSEFIGWACKLYAFAQASFIDRASNSYHLWIDVLARAHFIGRVSRGDPYLIGEKIGEIKFLLSDRAKCELQSTRFVGLVINASTEAFCFLVLKGKFRLQPGWINFNPSSYCSCFCWIADLTYPFLETKYVMNKMISCSTL